MEEGAPGPGGPPAVAFPGQGGSWADAVAVLTRRSGHPLVGELSECLGTAQWADLDPTDTRVVQPVIYVAGLIGPAADLPVEQTPAAMGHSLGEITAAAWSRALDPAAGLRLVWSRGQLGHQIDRSRPGAMGASLRWVRADVDAVLASAPIAAKGTAQVAVINGPTHQVITGDRAAVHGAVDAINEAGGVARILPIGGAYHSQLMAPIVDDFRREVRDAHMVDPLVPLVLSTAPEPVRRGDDLAERLISSLVTPVDWPAAIVAAHRLGVDRAVDAGPGDTLVRLGRHQTSICFAVA